MKEYLTLLNDDMTETLVEEPQSENGFTYADYLHWNFKERIELIKGKIFRMSPAPTIDHQRILGKIHLFLGTKLKHTPCEIFVAPVDVKLIGEPFKRRKIKEDEIFTVVQLDLIVVCDVSKMEGLKALDGAPEMVIEILSLGNTKTETKYKKELYEENGVLEYWAVHPAYKYVEVFLMEGSRFASSIIYEMEDEISCTVLKGITVPVNEIFK